MAEKIRNAIASISVPEVAREITASLGIAELLAHAGNAAGLLREADRAQYAAKAAGRNRTIVAVDTGGPVAGGTVAGAPVAEATADALLAEASAAR